MKILLFISLLSFSFGEPTTTSNGDLVVVVDNIKERKGELILALFNSESDFLKKGVKSMTVKVSKGGLTKAKFTDIPKGNYSISVIHDVNENGELDKNFAGMPKEGFGFSNNKMGIFGPPTFEECLVELTADQNEVKIALRKL